MRAFNKCGVLMVAGAGSFMFAHAADAGIVVSFVDASGLAGEAEFTLVDSDTITVRLRNTSTGAPGGFSNSDQLLTSVAFNLPGAISIASGGAVIGPTSASVNFDTGAYGPGTDVGGEWGYGNGGTTGFGVNVNYITSNTAGATEFGGLDLDGPAGLDGPQGGLLANPAVVPIGGLGAIQDEIIATINLDGSVSDLSFLDSGITFEFGSDAFFYTTPAPGSLALMALAGMLGGRRRRHA